MTKSARQKGSCLQMNSSWGTIVVTARDGRIASCELPALSAEPRRPFEWGRSRTEAEVSADARVLKKAQTFLRRMFSGSAAEAPPFAWPSATPFTIRVWKTLQAIPRGSTLQYGELADKIGKPRGARAVGRACGANPLPLFIPCHRVLPSDGTLGGFSSGLPWKRLLLERERAAKG